MGAEVPPPGEPLSDNDRQAAIESLQQALLEGRLAKDEFERRLRLALAAHTYGELRPVMAGLLAELPPWVAPPSAGDRAAAAVAHLLGIPTYFFGPLVMLAVTRNRPSDYARTHAAEALDFQLSVLAVGVLTLGVGAVIYLFSWACCVVAAAQAMSGHPFRYPLNLGHIRRALSAFRALILVLFG